ISGRPMMKFESGYNVETVFDGSKLGIEPHALKVLPNGELLVLDSANSNLYKISSSLSLSDGYFGHVDGRLREAKMNHPKGLTVDDKGNIYVADTNNMAIRKINDIGVTTIAGGKVGRGGHVDGPSEDAKFSNDFDVLYIGSSCSLLVIDRGNQAIREIQLPFDDCAYQYGSGFPLGIAVLVAAGFFGYMLALLQRRVGSMISNGVKSMRPPLIPSENEPEKLEEGFLASLGKLMSDATASFSEILRNMFPSFKKQQLNYNYPIQNHSPRQMGGTVTTNNRSNNNNHSNNNHNNHRNNNRHYSSMPKTYYEQSNEKTNEIVFRAVQEQAESMVIKPLDHYANPVYKHRASKTRSRSRPRGYTRVVYSVRDDVIRFRYGDEQHLDEALKRIFQYGLQKFATFFGPGITAEVGTGEEQNMYDVRLISDTTL
ncbi:putative six-bladed beta-propeller, TolB, partial [Tanacetum coccineum]